MDTAKGYTGQYADTLTGLDYYVSRYYDPVVGIFLSADVKEGNAAGMNPYAYVDGDPETLSDPSGEMVYCPGCGNGTPPPSPPPPNHGPVPCVGQDCGSNPPPQPKHLSSKQLAQLCVQSVQCMYVIQRYDDAQQSAYEQFILQFGLAFFESFDGDPDAFEQDLEGYQISEIELDNLGPGPFDNKILRAMGSSNDGTQLNGEMALMARMEGYNITEFNQIINGPNGTITDIDAAVPGVILEAKSGETWDSEDTNKLYIKLGDGWKGQIVNPNKEPVLVYAPSMPDDKVQWIQNTGAWVAQNEEQLLVMLWYLSPP